MRAAMPVLDMSLANMPTSPTGPHCIEMPEKTHGFRCEGFNAMMRTGLNIQGLPIKTIFKLTALLSRRCRSNHFFQHC